MSITNNKPATENVREDSFNKIAAQKSGIKPKKRPCPLKEYGLDDISYKNPTLLVKFTSEGGRILPARITGVSQKKKQRKLGKEIKRARVLGLLKF
jgi:small subunit ribosomal protein S18